jgi:putative hydrolase of the HAD superfamily
LIKAIFFDIGGTLRIAREGEARDVEILTRLIELLGLRENVDTFNARIHKGEKAYRRWCKPDYIELNEAELWTRFLMPDHPQEFIRANAVTLNQLWRESRHKYILPDMVSTLTELSRRGYKLGLISNTTSSVEGFQLLDETGLRDRFSTVILSAAFGRRKPHPSLFLAAAKEAGVLPEECVYVGDRPSRDLLGARQSGYAEAVIIKADGYSLDDYDPDDYEPEKDTQLEMKPDHWIRKLAELLEFYPPIDSEAKSETTPVQRYEAALSTMWGIDQSIPFGRSFEDGFSAGFIRFELNHKVSPTHLANYDRDKYVVSTIHEPCPAELTLDELKERDWLISSPVEGNRLKGLDAVKRSVELAVKLGARSVVVHPGSILCDRSRDRELRKLYNAGKPGTPEYEAMKQELIHHRAENKPAYHDAVRRSLVELIAAVRGSGVSIALENRYRYYDLPLPDEMAEFLALCNESWWGMQLDTGHAFVLEKLGLVGPDEWLNRFSARIIGAHLHDVIGLADHQVPGAGEVDFRRLAEFLPDNALRTLEIGPQASLREIKAGLEYLSACGVVTAL